MIINSEQIWRSFVQRKSFGLTIVERRLPAPTVKGVLKKAIALAALLFSANSAYAEETRGHSLSDANNPSPRIAFDGLSPSSKTVSETSELNERERLLLDRIEQLERRLMEVESRTATVLTGEASQPISVKPAAAQRLVETAAPSRTGGQVADPSQVSTEDRGLLDFFRDTKINLTLDSYYGYNFNRPVGRINLLRAFDVMSNSLSLNQTGIVVEHTPNPDSGRRFGARLDMQYGQATETLQGSAANELRPQVYRPVYQAYGTYIAPIGKGLTLDFGKFGSSIGLETNYSKDNLNYSRSYYYSFLPFYHFGLRAKYPINDRVSVLYHVMNGVNQSEDFNGFKSQQLASVITLPNKLTWQINYYIGREQRDVTAQLNPTFPSLPTQPGLSTDIIRPTPKGRFHVLDSYVTWNATDKLTLVVEADYVINRVQEFSPPSRVTGGAGYARYQFTPKFALAGRAEYLSDRGGLFSGVTQALKETTLTADFRLADGFILRGEWRRDFSNQEFFLTEVPGIRKTEQNTATLALIWWFGRKEGAW